MQLSASEVILLIAIILSMISLILEIVNFRNRKRHSNQFDVTVMFIDASEGSKKDKEKR